MWICVYVYTHIWAFQVTLVTKRIARQAILGIPQTRILEWVAMPSSRGSCWPRDGIGVFYLSCIGETHKVKIKLLSHVQLFVTPWTVAYQASPSMGFSRQEYLSGMPFPSPGRSPYIYIYIYIYIYTRMCVCIYFILGVSKITADSDCSCETKDACSLEEKLWPT